MLHKQLDLNIYLRTSLIESDGGAPLRRRRICQLDEDLAIAAGKEIVGDGHGHKVQVEDF